MGDLADCPPDVDHCEIVKPKQEAIKLPRLGDAEQRLREFERWLGREIPKHPHDKTRVDSLRRLQKRIDHIRAITSGPNAHIGYLALLVGLLDGGVYDPKSEFQEGTPDFESAHDYGNFQGGALLGAAGFSRYVSEVGAGAASIAGGTLDGAEGLPPMVIISPALGVFATWGIEPYGDYNVNGTAEWVGVGWDYQDGGWK